MSDSEKKILIPLLNGENVSRWLIFSHRISLRQLIKRKEYKHLEDTIEDAIESAKETL